MAKCLALLVFVGSLGLVPEGLAEDPRVERGPARLILANGLGSACKGELQLVRRALCFARLAKARNDVSVCDEADNSGVTYQCYHQFAQHAGDLTVCEKIPDQELQDECYGDLAALKDDPEICQRIVGRAVKDSCYFKIAKVNTNHALCQEIEDPELRSDCTVRAGRFE